MMITFINDCSNWLVWIQDHYRFTIRLSHEKSTEVVILYIEEWHVHSFEQHGLGVVGFSVKKLSVYISKRLHPLNFQLQLYLILICNILQETASLISWIYKVLEIVVEFIHVNFHVFCFNLQTHTDVNPTL